jgi:hypothetical protein
VESFLPHYKDIKIIVSKPGAKLQNLTNGQEIEGLTDKDKTVFTVRMFPTAYKAYKII